MLGEDDALIQNCARENLFNLEEDCRQDEGVRQSFVVVRETIIRAKGETTTTIIPHGIVKAHNMWEALDIFNKEHRDRVWVSESNDTRNDVQVGVDRCTRRNSTEVIRIYRMRKDQILRG